jgi:hypothetical protein
VYRWAANLIGELCDVRLDLAAPPRKPAPEPELTAGVA